MLFLSKCLVFVSLIISFVNALPNYFNYVSIQLDDGEMVDLKPVTQNGVEGKNYLNETYGTILRDHVGENAMLAIKADNSGNENKMIYIVANPEENISANRLRQLIISELCWLSEYKIVVLSEEKINTIVNAIMDEKVKGGAVNYSTQRNLAETIVGSGSVKYEIPSDALLISSVIYIKNSAVHNSRLDEIKVQNVKSNLLISFPKSCIGSPVKFRVFNIDGKLIHQSVITPATENAIIKESTLGCHGNRIFHFLKDDHSTSVVLFSSL